MPGSALYEKKNELRGPVCIEPAFVQIMNWHRTGDKPLSESIDPNLLTHIYASLDHNAWVTAGCQTLSRTNADLYPRNEHELDPNLCVFIEHHYIRKPVCGHWIYPLQIESKQTLLYVPWTVKDRSGFASGYRVALVVHRAQKTVPDSAGEWPTFLPPPLESCSGTANVDGPN